MSCFHDFTVPLRELFAGNLLLLFCSLFYLIWWVVCFKPNSTGGHSGGVFLAFAFLSGIAAIIFMSVGINALSSISKALPVRFILIGAVVFYFILLPITATLFHRQVTSELIIMTLWAALELCVIDVLYGTGRFDVGRMVVMAALIAVAAVVGLVCYIMYYRLNGTSSYIDGMIPLASDAAVMAAFLVVLALS